MLRIVNSNSAVKAWDFYRHLNQKLKPEHQDYFKESFPFWPLIYTACKPMVNFQHWLLFVSWSGQSNLLVDNITTFPVTLKSDMKLMVTVKGKRLSCLIKSIQKNSQFLSCRFSVLKNCLRADTSENEEGKKQFKGTAAILSWGTASGKKKLVPLSSQQKQ